MFLTRFYVGRTEGDQTKLHSQRMPRRLSSKTQQKRFYFLESKSDRSTFIFLVTFRQCKPADRRNSGRSAICFVSVPKSDVFSRQSVQHNGDCMIAVVRHTYLWFSQLPFLKFWLTWYQHFDAEIHICFFFFFTLHLHGVFTLRPTVWCSGAGSPVYACIWAHHCLYLCICLTL